MTQASYQPDEQILTRVVLNRSSNPEQPYALRAIDSGKMGFLIDADDRHIIEVGQHWIVTVKQDGHNYFKAELDLLADEQEAAIK